MATASSPTTRGSQLILTSLSLFACLALWHVAATYKLDLGLVSFVYVPPPAAVAEAAWNLAISPKLLPHLSSSLGRVFAGYFAAAVLGIGIGLFIGRWKSLESILLPPRYRRWPGFPWRF
jgi:NitT/TauT family transport system permease protein